MLSGRALNSHLENPGILVTEQRRSSEKPQREAVCLNPCSLYASGSGPGGQCLCLPEPCAVLPIDF